MKSLIINSKDSFIFIVTFILLGFLAFIRTPEMRTDSLVHFYHSIDAVSTFNFRVLMTNLWDKPIPLLVYGVFGQLGLFTARLSSVLLSIFSAFFTYRLAASTLKHINHDLPITISFFIFMLPILPQSYVTMTEIPAAFILSLGLYLFFVKHKAAWAFLVIGFLPLARLEAVLIMAFIFICFSFYLMQFHKTIIDWNIFLRIIRNNAIGSLPFIAWWLIGANYLDNYLWMIQGSYAHLRPFNLPFILQHNAVTALAKVFCAPMLIIFFVGLFTPLKMIKGQKSTVFGVTIFGILVIHLLFLSMFIVYAKGSVNWEKLIAAWNNRNFNVIAPILAFYLYVGVAYCHKLNMRFLAKDLFSKKEKVRIMVKLMGAYFLSWCVIYFCDKHNHLPNTSVFYYWFLNGSIVVIISILLIARIKSIKVNFIKLAALCMIVGFFATQPMFWYPSKYNDPDIIIVNNFKQWVKSNYPNQSLSIVHDLSGTLDRILNSDKIWAPWTWAPSFIDSAQKRPGTTLIVLTTIGPKQNPHPHYPESILKKIYQYKQVGKSTTKFPYGWIVYEKQSN